MLYEVRCRTCDISLAIAGSTLRITSSVTTSIEPPVTALMSARTEMNEEIASRRDLEPIARTYHRRARVLLNDRGAVDRGAARERVALVNRTVHRSIEPDAADRLGARRFDRRRLVRRAAAAQRRRTGPLPDRGQPHADDLERLVGIVVAVQAAMPRV